MTELLPQYSSAALKKGVERKHGEVGQNPLGRCGFWFVTGQRDSVRSSPGTWQVDFVHRGPEWLGAQVIITPAPLFALATSLSSFWVFLSFLKKKAETQEVPGRFASQRNCLCLYGKQSGFLCGGV
jgi:hypothetical protein